ncbi:MAG TPA: hypothetical protein PLZ36_11680 [Armatimonadota bacterium]|nr:hypothetical protein [Armatimonadota bacterium]
MRGERRISTQAVVVAAVVGIAAAGLTYLFVTRPRWRTQVVEMTHLALDVVGNLAKSAVRDISE